VPILWGSKTQTACELQLYLQGRADPHLDLKTFN
jgi:hypothetical protein